MITYHVKFRADRIGRSHQATPITLVAANSDALIHRIIDYAKNFLSSQEVSVSFWPTRDGFDGLIGVGNRSVGAFTATRWGFTQ